jgi:NAD(P)-dependent dehydrogenase (short-subunit alcohol dehydrogenase family)
MCAMPGRRLDGVRAVVTGAASGIGRSTAEAFVREGASVIVVDVNDEALGSVVDALGSSAIPVVADLARPNAGDGVAAEAEAFLGEIDVVVNNAGVSSKARFGQVLEQEWELLFRVNVDAAFQIAQRAVRSMIARRSGCILNVSSISGRGGGAPQSVYGITKGALLGLTRAWRPTSRRSASG